MYIREIKLEDAKSLLDLQDRVHKTSNYLLWEEDERKSSVADQEKMIAGMIQAANSTILVAVDEEGLMGYLFALGGKARRNRHSAYLVVAIDEKFRGKGVGTELFQALDKWAVQNGIVRLELTVIDKNKAGIALYKKRGFEVEGVKKDSLRIGDTYVDELLMAKRI